ncbi:hypothetical protein [Mesorhizobium sp.]|uniref:hypothetical protein n=1 Tax=Mesorhizobium sp. TaxID=1871066 RepID=UPI00257D96E8|nr:hypothetical protein [Mesorhizobium sp.]
MVATLRRWIAAIGSMLLDGHLRSLADNSTGPYFYIKPHVAGGLGENTVLDTSVHPPIVSKLHYQIEGWFDSALVTTFPCLLVTEKAKRALLEIGFRVRHSPMLK